MSFSVDVNLLLHSVNESDAFQQRAQDFMAERVESGEAFYLTWPTLMDFMRLATHPGVFLPPLSRQEAESNVSRLLALRQVRTLAEAPGFWETYREVTRDAGPVRSKLVPDAHVAAILRQHGVKRFYSRDRDFRRFDFLDVVDPLS